MLAALALVVGCSVVAGLDEEFGYPAYHDDAAVDASAPPRDASRAADSGPPLADVGASPDVYFADADEPPPDAAEAGCVSPSPCTATSCCAPGVCNASTRCVSKCVDQNGGCGNEGACCVGLHCTEKLSCQTTCVAPAGSPCSDQDAGCCVGLVCPPGAGSKCQPCRPRYYPCDFDWQCCGKGCFFHLCN